MDEFDTFLNAQPKDEFDSFLESKPLAKPQETGVLDRVKDVGVTALKGAVALPEAVVGLADIPTFGYAGKAAEGLGVRFKDTREILDSWYSPAQQEANRKVREAEGFVGTAKAALENPSTIGNAIIESAPMMVGGAGIARGLMKAGQVATPWAAGAIGEGIMGAGSAAEGIRQEMEDGTLGLRQVGSAIGSGLGTAAFGAAGGRLANKMGFDDIDTALARGSLPGGSKLGVAARMGAGAVSEGLLEEMPQSMQEQIWQNVALGKQWDEGIAEAGAMGLVTGAAMGGVFSGLAGRKPAPPPEQEAPPPPVNLLGYNPEVGTSWNNTYNYNPIIAEGSLAQVPLNMLDAHQMSQQRTEAAEMMNAGFSNRRQDALYDFSEFNFNDQTLPIPDSPGEAVAALQMLSKAQEAGQAVPEGSRAHEVILAAQEILRKNGLTILADRAPVVTKPGAKNAPTQVAEPSDQGAGGVGTGSQGNPPGQPGVGLGPSGPAGAPVVSGGTNRLVGNANRGDGSGVNARGRVTKAALVSEIEQVFPEGSAERDLHLEAIGDAKGDVGALRSLAKVSPEGLKLALRFAPLKEQQVVLTALGWDEQGNQVRSDVPTLDEVGRITGVGDRRRVQQILKHYGINEQVLTQMAAVNQEAVNISELVPSQQEDGGVQAGTGFRVMDSPSAADDIVDDRRTRIETHLANKAAEEMGVSAAELSQPSNYQTAAEVRAEEITTANREAAAAKEREAAARDEAMLANREQESLLSILRKSDPNIVEEDINNAREEWALGGAEALVPFDNLTVTEQASFVKATVSFYTTDSSMTAQRYANRLEELLDEARQRERSETSVAAPVRTETGGTAQLADQAAETTNQAQDAAEEGLTPQDIARAWNELAGENNLPKFPELTEDQQQALLEAYDGDSLQSAVNVVAQEVLDEAGGTKFSQADAPKAALSSKILSWAQQVLSRRAKDPVVAIVANPSALLKQIGIYRPITLDIEHAGHIMQTHPEIRPEDLAALPELLLRPRAAYVHGTGFNFIVDARDGSGQPLLVALNNTTLKGGGQALKVTGVSTMFGQENSAASLVRNLQAGNVKFMAQKEVARLQDLMSLGETPRNTETTGATNQDQDLRYEGSVPSLTGETSGYTPLQAEREISVATENGEVKLTIPAGAISRLQGVNFSETPESAGTDPQTLTTRLRKLFFSPEKFNKLVTVYPSAEAIPEDIKAKAAADANMSMEDVPWATVQGFAMQGKVYLVAGNIQPGNELAVFLHELGVHIGMEKLIGKVNMQRLSQQIEAWAKRDGNSQEVQFAKNAVRRAEGSASEDYQQEVIAYFVEEAVQAGVDPVAIQKTNSKLAQWFRQLWAAMQRVMREIGFGRFDSLSAQDIVDLAYGAANIALSNDQDIAAVEAVAPKFSQAAEKVESRFGPSGRQVFVDASNAVSSAFKWFMSLHDLVGEYGDKLPSANAWYKSVRETISTRKKLEADAEKIAARAGKLKGPVLEKLNDFIHDSTMEQKWGYNAEFDKVDGTKRKVEADPAMAKRFAELQRMSPEAAQIAKDIFSHGEMMKVQQFRIMGEVGLSSVTLLNTGALMGPYAPLKRFGNYIAVLKSKELVAAEKAEDAKRVDELKKDGKHYEVRFFDTMGLADRHAQDNKAKFAYAEAFKKAEVVAEGHMMKADTLQKVIAAVKAEKLDPRVKQQIAEMVNGMFLQAFDEQNARMSGLKRRNRAGADADMIRSFLSHARAQAGFFSSMKHGATTNELFYKMENESSNPPVDADRRKAREVFNAIAQHYAANLDHSETPIADRLTALTSVQQLATNPAYHLQNLSQPMITTAPRLAADFNDYSGAWAALLEGYKVAAKTGVRNIDLSKVTNPGLKAMLEEAENLGLLDVGMDENLAQFESTNTGYGMVDKASLLAKKALHGLRRISASVEATNRISAGTAAYNMAIKHGYSVEKAREYAISVLQDTQGDFGKADAPLIIKKLPKPVVQYRKFQLLMAAHYVKAFRDAFASEDPKVRAVGRRMLAYSLGHAGITAGALGLPMMNLVGLLFAKAGGDDDEPRDLERFLREQIGDETLANLLLRGPLWFMGMDAKLAQDKVFSFLPYADWDLTSKEGVKNLMFGMAGPAGSQALKMAGGLEYMSKGEYHKGLEGLLPSGVGNGIRAFRLANEGFTLKNGDVMVTPENINEFALALDSIGLKSPDVRRTEWYRNQQYEIKDFYQKRGKEIQQAYAEARRDGDADTQAEMRDKWLALQEGKARLRYVFNGSMDELKRQPLSTLMKYPKTQQERERKLQRAVPSELGVVN